MSYEALERLRALRMEAVARVEELDGLIAEVSPPGRSVVNLREFLAERHDFEWLVGGLLARGTLSMLVADPGLGKTTLMSQLTLSLVHGKSFLGGRVPGILKVLNIAAEGARGAYKARVDAAARALGFTDGEAWDRWFIQSIPFDDFRIGGPGLERLVKESDADLAILDTLGYFARFNENDPSEWKQRVAAPLRKLTNETGCSFILIHHPPKKTEANKDERDGRGTGAMLADCDHFWRLDVMSGHPTQRRLVVRKNRYGKVMDVDLAFDAANAIFRPVENSEPEAEGSQQTFNGNEN